MASAEVHKSDIGTLFKVTVQDGTTAVDVSTATTKQLLFKKPDGTVLTKTAGFFTDGTEGIITYSSISGDLNLIGLWTIQAFIIISAKEFHSDIARFRVHRNVE